jgi:hypothetical protein
MPDSFTLNLTVYQPDVMVGPGGQAGFAYDLTIDTPDQAIAAALGDRAQAASAQCDVVPVTGTLSFPNPAAPVLSPFTGLVFIYDNAPIIGFPLVLIAQSSGTVLPFNLNLAFPQPPLMFYSGAIRFGEWPGPLSDVTASFLCPQPI